MLRRYSIWIGETARSMLMERSTGSPVTLICGVIGETSASTSAMIRSQLRSYRARA